MKILKKVLLGFGILLLLLISVLAIRTATLSSKQVKDVPPMESVKLDQDAIASHLSKAIQCKTVSYSDPAKFDYAEFQKLLQVIETAFPKVHQSLKKEIVNQNSLLYTWEGSDKSLKPLILTAHMDVTGVEEGTEKEWSHPPFSGEIASGYIWGRGARDNKCQVMSILESAEYLLTQGFTPKRTIYLAFGHDEEVLGLNGAAKISELLQSRNIKPECVIDEGGAITEGKIPGVKGMVALIGTGEKGYVTLELSVKSEGGHSASPPKHTAIGILSKAIARLESNPFPATMECMEPMLEYAAPEMKFPMNAVAANLWLTEGILKKVLSSSPDTNASIRTTGAPTIIHGGFADNVLPVNSSAKVNFRLLTGDTVEGVIKRVKSVIDDKSVDIKVVGFNNNPPEMSPLDTLGFKNLQKTIAQVFPQTISVPYYVTGGTDAKHYAKLTNNLYRFTPSIKEEDESGHGANERIPVKNYTEYVTFFIQLMKNFQ